MANYVSRARTNYFDVNNRKAFNEFIERIITEGTVKIYEPKDKKPTDHRVGFGVVSGIIGFYDGPLDVSEADREASETTTVEDELQKLIADDDAAIIFESGYEGMRYLTGYATVITKNDIRCLSIEDLAIEQAQLLLKNPDWQTKSNF